MSLCEFSSVKIEEKAVFLYRRFRKIASIARTLEFFFAVVFLSRSISCSSAYFHAAVELCRFFIRRFCMLFVSHHFIFLLGNLIVITLFAKSGQSGAGNSGDDEDFLIGQFVAPPCDFAPENEVRSDSAVQRRKPDLMRNRRTRSEEFELGVRSDRETESSGVRMKVENLSNDEFQRKSGQSGAGNSGDDEEFLIGQFVAPPCDFALENEVRSDSAVQRRKPYLMRNRRTRSEEFELDVRSDRETESSGVRMKVEDLSNDEFQRKVEAFIERQQRFLREESLLVMKRH